MLDCFYPYRAFALNAAKAGAKSVTAVDVSQEAESARKNAELNGLNIELVCADVFDYLTETLKTAGRSMTLLYLTRLPLQKAGLRLEMHTEVIRK